jgi:hypothetical protein
MEMSQDPFNWFCYFVVVEKRGLVGGCTCVIITLITPPTANEMNVEIIFKSYSAVNLIFIILGRGVFQ